MSLQKTSASTIMEKPSGDAAQFSQLKPASPSDGKSTINQITPSKTKLPSPREKALFFTPDSMFRHGDTKQLHTYGSYHHSSIPSNRS